MYTYRIRKYIGQYAAAMGGVDIIVFTGGAGENQWEVREGATQGLEFMGVKMDEALNRSCRATEAKFLDGFLGRLLELAQRG